jgi:NTP pyrophosphatase (non-canonical NTP hydrolase)
MESKSELHLKDQPTMADFQHYVAGLIKECGFTGQPITEVFMRFSEEVGELAKAARKSSGLRVDKNSDHFDVGQEMADVFIYLLTIADHFNIDLEKAFREKEEINKQRVWE